MSRVQILPQDASQVKKTTLVKAFLFYMLLLKENLPFPYLSFPPLKTYRTSLKTPSPTKSPSSTIFSGEEHVLLKRKEKKFQVDLQVDLQLEMDKQTSARVSLHPRKRYRKWSFKETLPHQMSYQKERVLTPHFKSNMNSKITPPLPNPLPQTHTISRHNSPNLSYISWWKRKISYTY